LKRLESSLKNHYAESLPAPSLLSSSASILTSTQKHQQQQQHQTSENPSSLSPSMNNQNANNDVINAEPGNDGHIVVAENSMQQSQFIHHALSSANNRHRRSLTITGNRRLISKRYIVKRNFPNNQLSKASNEMDVDDSNETELDGTDDGENDDYVEGEKKKEQEKNQQQQTVLNGHDRLDDDDNESIAEKSMKLFIPYWDAYDTVNQLFLEISKCLLEFFSMFNCTTIHDLQFLVSIFILFSIPPSTHSKLKLISKQYA
jgi:hypothetical protein